MKIDVLEGVVDVLLPEGQPCHLVVVDHATPVAFNVTFRSTTTFKCKLDRQDSSQFRSELIATRYNGRGQGWNQHHLSIISIMHIHCVNINYFIFILTDVSYIA